MAAVELQLLMDSVSIYERLVSGRNQTGSNMEREDFAGSLTHLKSQVPLD
jgi:hypothetical protein